MMRWSHSNWLAILRLETDYSFRFPVVEGVLAVFLSIAVTIGIGTGGLHQFLSIAPGPGWTGSEMLEYYLGHLRDIATSAFVLTVRLFTYAQVAIIPLVVASSFGKSFDDRTLQTFLSYPITRKTLFLLRAGLVATLCGVIGTATSFLSVYLLIPGPKETVSFVLITAAFWLQILFITSITMLIAVVFKSGPATAGGGIGALFIVSWIANIMAASDVTKVSDTVQGLLSPVTLAIRLVSQEALAITPSEVAAVLLGAGLLGLGVLLLSSVLFERVNI